MTDINAILGMIFGLTGCLLGLSAYLRDRPKVIVTLKWGMKIVDPGTSIPDDDVGMITISNVGRRPVFLSHVALCMPKYLEYSTFLLKDGLNGVKLSEGCPPQVFTVSHKELISKLKEERLVKTTLWKKIRIQVEDSAGKLYYSKRVKDKPSWMDRLQS